MANQVDILERLEDNSNVDTRSIGLNWRIAKNGRNRAVWKHVFNPGSHNCVCGKVVSANKSWEHVQGCQIAQNEFKKAAELVKARRAEEEAKREQQGTAGTDSESQNTDAGTPDRVGEPGVQEDQQPDSLPETV